MTRTFDDKTHSYSTDGVNYVGVNELLKAEGLVKDLSIFIPADVLAYCCERGIAGHKIAELLLRGTLDESTIDTRLQHPTAELKRFVEDYGIVSKHIEIILWDDDNLFAGRTDLIADTKEGLAIIDWSFGKSNHYLALHAYKLLAKAHLNLDIEKLIDVSLPKTGKYKVKVYEPEERIENLITSALTVYNYRKGL